MSEVASDLGSLDDWRLLAAAGRGDEEAFREIVERHQDRVLRLCQRLLGDRQEAMDATQEVFLKTFRQAQRVEPRGELFTWLYRVATNHCLNKLRRRRIVRFLPIGPRREGEGGWQEPADGAATPDRQVAARQRWRATREAISRLPETQRVVLVLAKFEGMSYRQIARALDITEGAVESRLFRAMRNLAKAQDSRPSGVTP